jgi:hypothetical protein
VAIIKRFRERQSAQLGRSDGRKKALSEFGRVISLAKDGEFGMAAKKRS